MKNKNRKQRPEADAERPRTRKENKSIRGEKRTRTATNWQPKRGINRN